MINDFENYAKRYSETISLINDLDTWVYIKHLPKTRQKVLDIGCGSGDLLKSLSRYFKECYGIDSSTTMIDLANSKSERFDLMVGDANYLPYPDNFFDFVVSHTTFHHLDLNKALPEARRVLKNGGRLVIVDVVKEQNKIVKKFHKIVYRYIFSWGRMILKHGLSKTIEAWKFSEGPEWRNHVNAERDIFLTMPQFKSRFLHFLPNARFGVANHVIGYVTWTKP